MSNDNDDFDLDSVLEAAKDAESSGAPTDGNVIITHLSNHVSQFQQKQVLVQYMDKGNARKWFLGVYPICNASAEVFKTHRDAIVTLATAYKNKGPGLEIKWTWKTAEPQKGDKFKTPRIVLTSLTIV